MRPNRSSRPCRQAAPGAPWGAVRVSSCEFDEMAGAMKSPRVTRVRRGLGRLATSFSVATTRSRVARAALVARPGLVATESVVLGHSRHGRPFTECSPSDYLGVFCP